MTIGLRSALALATGAALVLAACDSGPDSRPTNDAGSNSAAVVQEGNRLGVTLSGADFILSNGRGNSFVGYLHTPDRVNFKISDAWWDDYGRFRPGTYDIVERVSGSEVFVFGSVPAAGTSARLSGRLEGTIARGPATGSPFQPFTAYCASSHEFEMVPR